MKVFVTYIKRIGHIYHRLNKIDIKAYGKDEKEIKSLKKKLSVGRAKELLECLFIIKEDTPAKIKSTFDLINTTVNVREKFGHKHLYGNFEIIEEKDHQVARIFINEYFEDGKITISFILDDSILVKYANEIYSDGKKYYSRVLLEFDTDSEVLKLITSETERIREQIESGNYKKSRKE